MTPEDYAALYLVATPAMPLARVVELAMQQERTRAAKQVREWAATEYDGVRDASIEALAARIQKGGGT